MNIRRPARLIALLAAGSLAGCGGAASGGASADSAWQLPALYKQNCMSCHGNQLQGRVGPNLQQVGDRLAEEEIQQLIVQGKGGMPAYGKRLSEADIASLAAWLSEQKRQEAP